MCIWLVLQYRHMPRLNLTHLVLTVRQQSNTPIRHNSEQGEDLKNALVTIAETRQDAIMYVVSGSGVLLVKGFEDDLKRHELSVGDFVFVPAWTEHQIRNETDQDTSWLVVQSGSHPVGAELTDWGGAEAQTRA